MFGEGFKVLLREIMSLSIVASFQVVLLVWWGFLVRVFRTSKIVSFFNRGLIVISITQMIIAMFCSLSSILVLTMMY